MIKKTIEKIEAAVRESRSLDDKKKKELAGLLADLKAEIGRLPQEKKSELTDLSLEGLSASVQELEASHPRLVKTVNDLCNLLAGIGI